MYVYCQCPQFMFFLLLITICIDSLDIGVRTLHVPKVTPGEFATTKIRCVLSDMDGTLLQPSHDVSERSLRALYRLRDARIPFFPATGRSRSSMAQAVGRNFLTLLADDLEKVPGVFCQGLMVYGPAGKLIYSRYLDSKVIEMCEDYSEEHSFSLISIANDIIYTHKHSPFTLSLDKYNEPIPTLLPERASKLQSKGIIQVNKVIFLGEETALTNHRPRITQILSEVASITKAVPGMLEVLPLHSSKGDGVEKLLTYYGISPTETIAFGDGENDIEMLAYVKYGIAMSNSRHRLLDYAYRMTRSNAEDGVAEVIEQLTASNS